MLNKGYQPNKGNLDPKNPPKGGSGLMPKTERPKPKPRPPKYKIIIEVR